MDMLGQLLLKGQLAANAVATTCITKAAGAEHMLNL
jgi:hypothetical protein